VLQTLVPNEPYRRPGDIGVGEDAGTSLDFGHYIDVLKRRLFYFLLPFGLISVLGTYFAAIQKPNYLSEGKILIESQRIASDYVRPIMTLTAGERIQVIQQRLLTRDNLLSISNKFHLFPGRSGVVDLMRESTQIKAADFDVQARQGQVVSASAFTVGFEYENPDLAMRVANELVTLIVDEDEQSRTSRATEAVKILTGETRDLEDKLQSTQAQLLEVARRPHDPNPESAEKENPQLAALAVLKAELIQKTSIYSDAHPAVTALRKRIAAMEKSQTQAGQVLGDVKSTQVDEKDALKRQKEGLEKRLADANSKLAAARLSEKLDRDQQSERLQVLESPPLPQKPLKSGRLRLVGMAFGLATVLGIASVMAIEVLNGSITSRHQLIGVVDSHLIIPIPYLTLPSDIIRARLRKTLAVFTVVTILIAWGGLSAAILLQLPVDFFRHDQTEVSLSPTR
jgi:uncharacterized protein involved in exopolysaccharide biosynthesis